MRPAAAGQLALVLPLGTAPAAPQDSDVRGATTFGEGTRRPGQAFALISSAGKKLPRILMAHSWGRTVGQVGNL
jgi:hypothetical protein